MGHDFALAIAVPAQVYDDVHTHLCRHMESGFRWLTSVVKGRGRLAEVWQVFPHGLVWAGVLGGRRGICPGVLLRRGGQCCPQQSEACKTTDGTSCETSNSECSLSKHWRHIFLKIMVNF